MSENKTQKTNASVIDFLNSIPDEKKRQDCLTVFEIMRQVTGLEPKMWGASIVGFGDVHYKYASGREGDWFKVGFSPRKQNLTLYIMDGFPRYQSLLADLGKHKTGVSCLYINKLADVNLDVLREMIAQSIAS
ncbi:MAG: hypothetical protein CVU44_01570 [Chloroflexi bacterium HGW-Chloroflexi-6]|nr:MAG: hypothetical protein CVU44_01570 [Chloroflexi bacterium HGW-Chloroflexi-6]